MAAHHEVSGAAAVRELRQRHALHLRPVWEVTMAFRKMRLACCIWGFALALLGASAARAEPRAVVELFTSQGCSSCPAADKLLGELARDPSVVAISLPIDYWDYLGWKDTLASPRNTARQRAYAGIRADRQVYTPQMVVNGAIEVLGSDKAAIERAIAQSRRETMTLPVTFSSADGKFTVSVPDGEADQSGEVWLCSLAKAVPIAIGRGENRGRTVTYFNVARRWVKLGDWTGKAANWSLPMAQIKTDGVDAAAVIVQAGRADNPGKMIGASVTTLD